MCSTSLMMAKRGAPKLAKRDLRNCKLLGSIVGGSASASTILTVYLDEEVLKSGKISRPDSLAPFLSPDENIEYLGAKGSTSSQSGLDPSLAKRYFIPEWVG
ncbi:hypothetical protein Tco_0684466 [Tanacetum coccineum]